MTSLSPTKLGLCSWSTRPQSPADLISRLRDVGLSNVQLALGPLATDPQTWGDVKTQLDDAGITIVSGMFGCIGENYATPQTIRQTGGYVPDQHWPANWQNIQTSAKHARDLGLTIVTSHAGFIPEEPGEAYDRIVDRTRQIADLFRETFNGKFLLETGQETADTLHAFLQAVDRPNLGVNFDPANMILYGMGDPIDAIRKLIPHVGQVHIKDATPPATPGEWGVETPIGQGKVDWPTFLGVLAENNFDGHLVIEREAGQDRVGDIRIAIDFITNQMEQLTHA